MVTGDVLHDRYRIVDKLGSGGYSIIWLARDDQLWLESYVALKVGMSDHPLPRRELSILRALDGSGLSSQAVYTALDPRNVIPSILDELDIQGPDGAHVCYTMTPAQGNLREASFSRLFPVEVARALAAKLAIAVSFVHSQGLIHGGWSYACTNYGRNTTESL